MKPRRLLVAFAGMAVVAAAAPAAASAHAALLRTSPVASVITNSASGRVLLTYSEAVEPRFAIVSVTDAAGHQVTTGPPSRSATDPDTLVAPLARIPSGWYLVYWRVISADGHPVRGAFTFAVGPNPGPAPVFPVPSTSETAATGRLLVARWIVFLAALSAVGLYVLRVLTARPVVRAVRGSSLRAVTWALWICLAVALIATPIYLDLSTAQFALRSPFAVGAIVPLVRASAFGRAFLCFEVVLGLFALSALVTVWVDRPDRQRRSIAELLAVAGGLSSAGALFLVPGIAGHANTTSPRALSLLFDWVHLAAAAVWVGGLVGLLVLWRSTRDLLRVALLSLVVPRFSRIAFVSVVLLIGAGTGASVLHMPTLSAFWQTSYGQALGIKILLLAAALLLAAVNLARTKPRLEAAASRPELARGAAVLLRRLVAGETVFVWGAVFAAAVLSSLAPPSKALGEINRALARVGPGPVNEVVHKSGYTVAVGIAPNRAAAPATFKVRITRNGAPVTGASLITQFTMLDMEMGQQQYAFRETAPGVYERSAPALVMAGHWALSFQVVPPRHAPFDVLLVDRAQG
ncbi:MAG: copper resistance protein CopC [Gaiellaceae bacterium]